MDAGGQNWPKISIVTPSFNQGTYIEDCICSILDQKYPDLEYFIIDGGSSDESVQIIRKYASQLSGWISEPDRGQSDAINKGLKQASGDLVAWLNADDYYLIGALQEIAQAYWQNPEAPFYFGDGLRVDENKTRTKKFLSGGRRILRPDSAHSRIELHLAAGNFHPQGGSRKSRLFGYEPALRHGY